MPTHMTAFKASATTGAQAKDAEKTLEQRLQDEAYLYDDIRRIPVLESSSQGEDVLLWILREGVEWQARFVMKSEEDRVVAVKETLERLQNREAFATPAYFGKEWTTNTMVEADGER